MKALFTSFLFYIVSCIAQADIVRQYNDPEALFKKMLQAEMVLDYQGVFIYLQADQVKTIAIKHWVDSEGIINERLSPLNGKSKEVVRKWQKSHYWEKGIQATDSSFHISLKGSMKQLKESYEFHLLGKERIAGRSSYKLFIQPKDDLRYGYYLWVDQATGLLLKSILYDESKHVIEQYLFTQIHIDNKKEKYNEEHYSSIEIFVDGLKESNNLHSVWYFDKLPKGFKVLYQKPGKSLHHLLLTDGLASVSVFIEPLKKEKKPVQGFTRVGATCVVGSLLDNHQLAIIGEVPVITIEKIIKAINYQKHSQKVHE
jgi:sigma-E factor negative regulatory protein RseB